MPFKKKGPLSQPKAKTKMFPQKFHVCDAFGIPVYVDFSFLILMILFVMEAGSFTLGIACALALAVSILLHELGHSLTARAFGYRTRLITLSLLGGCASLCALPRKAWQEFLTAAAGPAVSFILSIGCFVFCWFVPMPSQWAAEVMGYFIGINFVLGSFNLLPGFPLDGGRIFRSLMRAFMSRAKATFVAMVVGRIVAVGLGILGISRIFSGAPFGFITVLIAWMIWREGYREYQMALQEERWGFDNPYGWSARVSSAPYSDDDDQDVDVYRGR